MSRARRNPMGAPKPPGVTAVRLGGGDLVHCLNPKTRHTLCRSGAGRARSVQPLYKTGAKYINCYRCAKLMTMNVEAGRRADEA